jgi:aspartate 1-decarboxylase
LLYDRELQKQNSKEIIQRWEWLTEGVEDYQQKLDLSIVLENAKDSMTVQNNIDPQYLEGLLNEDINTSGGVHVNGAGADELIPKVIFPMIRRVFPNLIANKLVGVQPLSRPTGIIYYLVYKFSNTKGDVTAGDEYDAFPWDGDPNNGFSATYSMDRIGPFTGTIAAAGGDTTIASNQDTFFDQAETGKQITSREITGVEIYNTATGAAYSGFTVNGTPGAAAPGANEITADPDTDVIVLNDAAAAPWSAGDEVTIFLIYNLEASEKMPELELTVDSIPVETKERKLKVRWTKESEQDFKAYHQIDIENELVKAAAQEMTYEIDREIIGFIEKQVIPELSLYHNWTADTAASGNNTQGNYYDRHRALTDKILRLSAKIATYNRQGPANWMVCSPQTGAILAQLPSFKTEMASAGSDYNVKYMGKLNGSIDVYVDPNRGFNAGTGGSGRFSDTILVGFKQGNNPYASGIIYSPYTNWMSNVVIHPDNFNSIRGFFTRYALTKVVRGQYYYGKLTVDNLVV